MRALATILVLFLVGAAAALAFEQAPSAGAELSTVAATGSFSFTNSGAGEPIFAAADLAPGHSARGTVEIANGGELPGEVTLTQSYLSDSSGLGGAMLSKRLTLLVRDVTAPAAPATVYSGPLALMAPQAAGRIEAGATHRYEFVATLPEEVASANDLQGASAEVSYSWTAREASARPQEPVPATTATPASGGGAGLSAPPAAAPPLRLEIRAVERVVRHGRLTVLASCNQPCRISARGSLWAVSGSASRGAKAQAAAAQVRAAGTAQRLRVRVPHRLVAWSRQRRSTAHLRARLSLHARNAGGQTATVRRTVRRRIR